MAQLERVREALHQQPFRSFDTGRLNRPRPISSLGILLHPGSPCSPVEFRQRRFFADLVQRFLEDRLWAFLLGRQNDDDHPPELWNKHAHRVSLLQNAGLVVGQLDQQIGARSGQFGRHHGLFNILLNIMFRSRYPNLHFANLHQGLILYIGRFSERTNSLDWCAPRG